jgi:hypothetical protein
VIEYEKALKLFKEYDYKNAWQILDKISKEMRGGERDKYDLLKRLAYIYSSWEEMNFAIACTTISELIDEINQLQNNVSPVTFLRDKISLLSSQKEILSSLEAAQAAFVNAQKSDDNVKVDSMKTNVYNLLKQENNSGIVNLVFFLYAKAERKAKQGDYDTAALLFYRILELISSRRLAKNHNLNILNKELNLEGQQNQYRKLNELQMQDKEDIYKVLPNDITYFTEIIETAKKRNRGIYTHGFKKVEQLEYTTSRNFTKKWIERFCIVEGINFEKTLYVHTFLSTDDFI